MGRSAILSGRIQQRDRAQARGRHDRRAAAAGARAGAATPLAELKPIIERFSESVHQIERFEQLDLHEFLQHSGHIEMKPAERLRRLAIALEWAGNPSSKEQPRSWLALDRIYAYAHRLDPEDWVVLHSRGISATECGTLWDVAEPARRRILAAGRQAFRTAEALASDPYDVAYSMGQLEYRDPDTSAETALEWFRRALDDHGNERPDRGWAQIYVAHCLHDLKRYTEAMEAYDRVEARAFTGLREWRYALLAEQRAQCQLLSGDVDGARRAFTQLIERYEARKVLDDSLLSFHLAFSVRDHFPELKDRVAALAQRHNISLVLEWLEPKST